MVPGVLQILRHRTDQVKLLVWRLVTEIGPGFLLQECHACVRGQYSVTDSLRKRGYQLYLLLRIEVQVICPIVKCDLLGLQRLLVIYLDNLI